MKKLANLSIVVPTLNEAGNLPILVSRIDTALRQAKVNYEIIVVDDNSTDNTRELAWGLSNQYPISCHLKQGKQGKAYSLLEGFGYAKYDLLAILDGDCQYPPEDLPEMVYQINQGHDVVVANRVTQNIPWPRRIVSQTFSLIFAKWLHGLDCDVQSGMKVFKKQVIDDISLHPTAWTFDLEFLISAHNLGYSIGAVDIIFGSRLSGNSKIHLARSIAEIGSNAIYLKIKPKQPARINPYGQDNMAGAGVAHNKKRFITHTTLEHQISALKSFVGWQKSAMFLALVMILLGLFINPIMTGVVVMAILSALYFIDVLFNLYLVRKSLSQSPEIVVGEELLRSLDDSALPTYTILCPLYKESEVLPNFLEAIENLEWPKNKLDVQLLLEEDDKETLSAAEGLNLPPYVRTIVVPHSMPKTKPKACNFGLAQARGEYLVIYDAEDIPDPWQLKKAYLGFQKSPVNVVCLQAKLNYFNHGQNLLTRLFTAEYSLWFDVTLPGLQSINTYIPLGGTSNHFKTAVLKELEGWDPFNVTEDCDLGIRLFRKKYTTAIIDSVTLEEANSNVRNWIRQRSRWIKGYMQTYLVHMRNPIQFARYNGWHALIFQLVVGGKIAFALINPILWITTIAYFSARATIGPTIEELFPSAVFFMAAMSLVFGNFLFLYYYMIGLAKRNQWELIKHVYFIPFYWMITSIASYLAFYQLLVKPHYWEKTHHGLHVKNPVGLPVSAAMAPFRIWWVPIFL
ncbi:MAG: hypothetical protein COT81_05010 [Candidatus Buchananbacteria bacterium CG10_big_fil_rev_8_21_14_0_10_42_9]|uniref:Glycosyltransferase 2-like domain-containing protein n=1 Tax=Candidatus Buchananbacteria bacterium CG10_big_fil_rev_8_21_14_0_10_42_9 TaxID=1974526 RepID=A0A2H0W061_9BACT|nr:MAG: hypothetical protein COT81_05010 [Candidatus Buchananbacteria bacterium CG10_big_fil_rev_8_21_14_0_10_42_9]